jgi:hypothetical protein
MLRHWKLFVAAVTILTLSVVAGNYVLMVVLTLLMPVYTLLLASVFLLIFLLIAVIVVPVGRWFLDKGESRIEAHPPADLQERRAA